jgi:hypothetical protein
MKFGERKSGSRESSPSDDSYPNRKDVESGFEWIDDERLVLARLLATPNLFRFIIILFIQLPAVICQFSGVSVHLNRLTALEDSKPSKRVQPLIFSS